MPFAVKNAIDQYVGTYNGVGRRVKLYNIDVNPDMIQHDLKLTGSVMQKPAKPIEVPILNATRPGSVFTTFNILLTCDLKYDDIMKWKRII